MVLQREITAWDGSGGMRIGVFSLLCAAAIPPPLLLTTTMMGEWVREYIPGGRVTDIERAIRRML